MLLLLLCLWQMTSVLLFLLTQFPEKSKGFMSEVSEGKLPTSQRAKRAMDVQL